MTEKKRGFSLKPNIDPTQAALPADPKEFIRGASSHTVLPGLQQPAQRLPKVGFQLRLPAELHARLQLAASKMKRTSMHDLVLDAIQEKLDALEQAEN